MADATTIYRVRPGVLAEPIGEVWAVYSPASGETRLLNDEAAAYLELLAEMPRPALEAATALAAEIEVDAAEVRAHVADTFHLLEMAGLIEQLPADAPRART
ncbi:MAG: HPr-rel-A system PqqD family peptide chaperone [Rubrivivax sp.]|nr:HPr-rel-A system PqqD family peptide chaperone [Rubrivivax sp.]